MLHEVDPWPGWSTNYSESSWHQLILIAKALQKSDPKSVREALQQYQSQSSEDQKIYDDGKLYILLRVVFQLPERAMYSGENPVQYGWASMGTAFNDGTRNFAWPIVWNDGHPRLVAGFQGYEGPNIRYYAPEEYDYFKGHYPFRDLSSFK